MFKHGISEKKLAALPGTGSYAGFGAGLMFGGLNTADKAADDVFEDLLRQVGVVFVGYGGVRLTIRGWTGCCITGGCVQAR